MHKRRPDSYSESSDNLFCDFKQEICTSSQPVSLLAKKKKKVFSLVILKVLSTFNSLGFYFQRDAFSGPICHVVRPMSWVRLRTPDMEQINLILNPSGSFLLAGWCLESNLHPSLDIVCEMGTHFTQLLWGLHVGTPGKLPLIILGLHYIIMV